MAVLVAAAMLVPVGLAQTDVHALQKELKGKQLALRNYAADPSASYVWNNGTLVAEPVAFYTFGVFTTKSVKLKRDTLIIEGTRATIVRDRKTGAWELDHQTPMKLKVDLHGTDQSTVVPELQNMMFFPDVQTALAGLPAQIAGTLNTSSDSQTPCKCQWIDASNKGDWLRVDFPSPRLVVPKLLYSVEPDFSAEARQNKVSGNVKLFIDVSATGHVNDIWLARGFGYGLDEAAEKAARQYVFKPATYDGKPVKTVVDVQINFQTF
ncbi:energy transducer TonB [Edaphobacter sp.]|uniref:energy transducer TonB n=1 Tax=Edaphobacter sp. TaxID=1934404 RepID=UPI002DB89B4F|nr:energy transducer TonB [Edaphobacter sp.]HEU5339953.1 energy transducer TonB [Edaphobacter sp.]